MPESQDHPIELRLKEYAEQRRRDAGGPFAPPPLLRQVLRTEVNRRWGQASRQAARARWWDTVWPRLGWALGVAAVLAVAILAVVDRSRLTPSKSLARGTPTEAPTTPTVTNVAPPSALSSQPPATRTAPDLESSPTVESARETPPLAVPTSRPEPPAARAQDTAPRPTPPTRAGGSELVGAPQIALRYGLTTAPPQESRPSAPARAPTAPAAETPAAAPLAAVATGRGVAPKPTELTAPAAVENVADQAVPAAPDGAPPVTSLTAAAPAPAPSQYRFTSQPSPARSLRRFSQNQARPLRQNLNSPPPTPVLQQFQVQQIGNQLQFLDRDGSTYVAELTPAADAVAPAAAESVAPLEKRQSARSQNQNARTLNQAAEVRRSQPVANALAFNAVGTNRTLQQQVVFDGRLVFTNSQVPVPALEPTANNDAAIAIWLNNSIVEGQAVIGGRTRIDVQAQPNPE